MLAQDVDDLEKIDEAVQDAAETLTAQDVALAVFLLLAGVLLALVAGRVVSAAVRRLPGDTQYLSELLGRVVRYSIILAGIGSALGALGVDIQWITLAVALVAILVLLMVRPLIENGAAGLLLTSRPSFSIGDDIESNGYAGEVVEINARSTVIKTPDWRRVHIPNGDVLADPIVVYNAFDRRRSELELEVDYNADIADATQLVIDAAVRVEGVLAEPSPQVRARGYGNGTVVLLLRWWHDSHLSASGRTLNGVVHEVKQALDHAGVDMPAPEVIVRRPAVDGPEQA